MPDKHPYATTLKAIPEIVGQLRKSFPTNVDASTIKKYGIAPKNESYIINILKYLDLIGENGTRTETAARVFTLHGDNDFQDEFSKVVENAYSDLFELFKDEAWHLDEDRLISFFRNTDQSTDTVGTLQAKTFNYLSVLSGKAEAPQKAPKAAASKPRKSTATSTNRSKKPSKTPQEDRSRRHTAAEQESIGGEAVSPLNLTLRIEINLPSNSDKETYDHIFASLKRNIIDGLRNT